jgi:hypothetical protein
MNGIPAKWHASAPTLHTLVLPRLPQRIRRLVDTAYTARGGADHMHLDQWRDVEQELEQMVEHQFTSHK